MRDDDMETYRDCYHDDNDLVLEEWRACAWSLINGGVCSMEHPRPRFELHTTQVSHRG